MPVTVPPGLKAEGNSKVAFVLTIANPSAPTVAEVTAASGVDISFFLMAGAFQPNQEQARGDDRRYASKQVFQTLGRKNASIADIRYIADPQAAPGTANNKAMEVLAEGQTGFAVVRYGLDAETVDFTAAQKVDVWPVICGVQNKTPLAEDDEFAKITITQALAVTGLVRAQVALA